MKPQATIGISFRDPGRDLALAVKSVFAQSFADWELILCDDGSVDDSLEFARSLDDPRVRLVSDGRRESLSIRLNQMVSMARGDFFFRMDADDLMHPDRLQKQLSALWRHPDGVVGTSAYAIDEQSRVTGLKVSCNRQRGGFAARHSFFHSTVAASVNWFRKNKYSEQTVYYRAEDAELWCRTTSGTQFSWIAEPLTFIREVGVFSYTKHIGTSLGVLHLVGDQSRNTAQRLCLLTRELGKIWIMSVADALDCSDWIVRRRGAALPQSEIHFANQMVNHIRRQELPTKASVLQEATARLR